MGRPPTHTADDFVDAAVRLFAEGGARAVTMASVAREVGAPSGSIYHRFADRPALLAAVWLRTVRRFQDAYVQVIQGSSGADAAVAASASVVGWCREHVHEAVVLQAGPREFSPETWSQAARAELAGNDVAREKHMGRVIAAVAAETGRQPDEVAFALVELPLAVMRKHLARAEPPPEEAADLVSRIARLILIG